jgi:para-nitrobenzyl esterase
MGIPVPDHAAAEAQGKELSDAGDALNIAGLRKLTPTQLDARVNKTARGSSPIGRFGPSVDGWFLPDAATVGKNTNDTPILTGMTADEMTGLDASNGKLTPADFSTRVMSTYGTFASDIGKLYPAKDDRQAWSSFGALSRDRGLASMYFWAQERLPNTRKPIYAYLWTHTEPGPEAARYKAFHSSELPYVFNTLDTAKRPFTAEDRALADQMSTRWVSFVKTGEPNAPGLPRWPTLTAKDKQILEIDSTARARPVLSEEPLSVFDRYVKSGGKLGLF